MADGKYFVEWPDVPDRTLYANRYALVRGEDGIEFQFAYVPRDGMMLDAARVVLTMSGVSLFTGWRATFGPIAGAYGVDRGLSWGLPTGVGVCPLYVGNTAHMAVYESGGGIRFGWLSAFDIAGAVLPSGPDSVVTQSAVEVRMVPHMLTDLFEALERLVATIEPTDYPHLPGWVR